MEVLLKDVIHQAAVGRGTAKKQGLEETINACMALQKNAISAEDRKILGEFKKNHLNYLNLGTHGNLKPNADRLRDVRDCLVQFIKRNI